ncbi:phage minor head protein [Flavobacterium columnare]|uniref:phage head morphogenesis protein n=1 Tax=Flavobacterium columnare TaxID=996 RepID=UPI0013D492E1|nr:phage minor head protein [Flavobacterium columnare]
MSLLKLHYRTNCCSTDVIQLNKNDEDNNLSRLIESYIRQLFEDREVSREMQERLFAYYYQELSKGVDVGYSPTFEMYDEALAVSFKKNIADFSAFKATSFKKQLESLLVQDGKITPWSEFKKQADALHIEYNRRWLKTEYHQTVAVANMAQQWQQFEADADLYPNLKYNAVNDGRTREAHKSWDGLVLPIKHPFWTKHLPPNDWGCRCTVTQTDEAVSKEIPDIKSKGAFSNNPAMSGAIFKENTYEKGLDNEGITESKELISDFLASETNLINTKNPKVRISLGADLQDLRRNYQVADICADKLNIDFLIRTHVEIKGVSNPEYLLFGEYLGDRKSIEGIDGILWNIDQAKKQMLNKAINPKQVPYYIVWDMDKIIHLNTDEIIRALQRKVNEERGRSIKGMIFQYKGRAVHLTREQIVKRDFANLKSLK